MTKLELQARAALFRIHRSIDIAATLAIRDIRDAATWANRSLAQRHRRMIEHSNAAHAAPKGSLLP